MFVSLRFLSKLFLEAFILIKRDFIALCCILRFKGYNVK